MKQTLWSQWFIQQYFSVVRVMLAHRLQRWTNNNSTLDQRLMSLRCSSSHLASYSTSRRWINRTRGEPSRSAITSWCWCVQLYMSASRTLYTDALRQTAVTVYFSSKKLQLFISTRHSRQRFLPAASRLYACARLSCSTWFVVPRRCFSRVVAWSTLNV